MSGDDGRSRCPKNTMQTHKNEKEKWKTKHQRDRRSLGRQGEGMSRPYFCL